MRALVQRVCRSAVHIEGRAATEIGPGRLILVGIGRQDASEGLGYLAEKCANLRVFEDAKGKMNRSLLEVQGEALVVSQFTLYGDVRKGRRPSFAQAALPEAAEPLYMEFAERLRALGVPTKTGVFGAHMRVEIHNDGPVTLMVETP